MQAWDDRDIALLKRLLADPQRMTYGLIGSRIGGKSRNSVAGMVGRLGLSSKAPKPRGPRPPRKPRVGKLALIPKEAVTDDCNGGNQPSIEVIDGIPYGDASNTVCRYPLWPDTQITGNVCGLEGFPWCEGHRKIVYRPRVRS